MAYFNQRHRAPHMWAYFIIGPILYHNYLLQALDLRRFFRYRFGTTSSDEACDWTTELLSSGDSTEGCIVQFPFTLLEDGKGIQEAGKSQLSLAIY